jgi:Animal haem peroxidase
LETQTRQNVIGNQRTARFDLDCVYGSGPDDQPYLYAADGASLVLGATLDRLHQDLARAPGNGRALIGDPRNDENSIVNQIHSSIIRFHNSAVQRLARSGLQGRSLFQRARTEVRWTYQRILVDDFLPRIVSKEARDAYQVDLKKGEPYKLFKKRDPLSIPVEFSGAAYRFGHSMVRNGYRLNDADEGVFHIFASDGDKPDDSLVGFEPLPATHVINKWSRFYPLPSVAETEPGFRPSKNDVEGRDRLQFAYKIDTSVVDPLAHLAGGNGQSLILRNLQRGAIFKLACGEAVAKELGVDPLPPEQIVVRREKDPVGDKRHFDLLPTSKIHNELVGNTPLWLYILSESQQAFTKKVWKPCIRPERSPLGIS